jgi:hypothetical protein
MSDLLQTDRGDLQITDNALTIIDGETQVRQLLAQRLRSFLGEWFLDTTIGVPYYQSIMEKNPNPGMVEAIFKNEILATPGVLELTAFSLEIIPSTREADLRFTVRSTSGLVEMGVLV